MFWKVTNKLTKFSYLLSMENMQHFYRAVCDKYDLDEMEDVRNYYDIDQVEAELWEKGDWV